MQSRQLDRSFDRIGAIVDEEAASELSRCDIRQEAGQGGAPGFEQFLAVERHAFELVAHRLNDAGVVDAATENAIAAQAVDVLAAERIAQDGALSLPLQCGELTGFSNGLAVGNEAAIDVSFVGANRLGDETLQLRPVQLFAGDEVEIPL